MASHYAGVPYLWGGTTPAGFDCSGYVQYVYGRLGIGLPRTTDQQYASMQHVARAQMQPGDVVFVPNVGGGLGHEGIYAGANTWWDSAHSGTRVARRLIWTSTYLVGRRVAAPVPPAAASHPTLQQGARGVAVALVQRHIGAYADGDFGPLTRAAVVRQQQAHRLVPDGVVGPLTWHALGL